MGTVITLAVFVLAVIYSSKSERADFVLIPLDTGDETVTVHLEIQTIDVETTGPVTLSIDMNLRQLRQSFNSIADIKYDFQLTNSELPRLGIIQSNAIYVSISGLKNTNAVSLKARLNSLAPIQIYPVISLGNTYKAISYCQVLGSCILGIAAGKDQETNVTVKIPGSTDITKLQFDNSTCPNDGHCITLGSYDMIWIECKQCDLTNTLITSTRNVAVFGGGYKTVVRKGTKESIFIAQMPYLHSWGKEFILMNSDIDAGGDLYRIISRFDKTQFTIDGYKTIKIKDTTQYYQRLLEFQDHVYVTSEKPIMISQFLYDGWNHAAMINVPPAEQYGTVPISMACSNDTKIFLDSNSWYSVSTNTSVYNRISTSGFALESLLDVDQDCQVDTEGFRFAIFHRNDLTGDDISYLDANYINAHVLQTVLNKSSKTMEPGDMVDNDGDGMIDEDICEEDAFFLSKDDKYDFQKSLEECSKKQMTLAYLNTLDRNEQALDYLRKQSIVDSTPFYIFIGLSRTSGTNYSHTWADGENLTESAWLPGEPMTFAINDDRCTAFQVSDLVSSNIWTEHDCNRDFRYLCTSWANNDGKDCKLSISEYNSDNKGKSFIFPVWNIQASENHNVKVEVAVTTDSPVTLFHYKGGRLSQTKSYASSFSDTFNEIDADIPDNMTLFRLETDGDMTLHVLLHSANPRGRSLSSIILPMDAWGTEYFAANPSLSSGFTPYCIITHASPQTNVSFLLPDINIDVEVSTMSQYFVVNRTIYFHVEIRGREYIYLKSEQDLTGTFIKGDNPISVICGGELNTSASIVGEQLIPIKYYPQPIGQRYIYSLYLTEINEPSMLSVIRVLTSQRQTTCTVVGTTWVLQKRGNALEYRIDNVANKNSIWCTHPVFVWNTIKDEYRASMSILQSDSQLSTHQTFRTFRNTPSNVNQQLYIYKKLQNFPLNYEGSTWSGVDGFVTNLAEESTYTFTTTHKNISFVLWNVANFNTYGFGTNIAISLQKQYVCELGTIGDSDCDGKYYEENCTLKGYNFLPFKYLLAEGQYLFDLDSDGMFDEDCVHTVPDCLTPNIPFTTINDYDTNSRDTFVTLKYGGFRCDPGYSIYNTSLTEITCYADSIWRPEQICYKDCEDPTLDYPHSMIIDEYDRVIGSNVTMACGDGYSMIGNSSVLECTENSTWTQNLFFCAADCNNPESLMDKSVVQNSSIARFLVGISYMMDCDSGYGLYGNGLLTCFENSTWSVPEFECLLACSDPRELIPHSSIFNHTEGTLFWVGSIIKMECNVSTTLVGNSSMTCTTDSVWDHLIQCIPDCGDPLSEVTVSNASLVWYVPGSSTAYNVTYRFRCKLKYRMVGSGYISCLDNSSWSLPQFYCKPCKCPCRRVGTPRYNEVTPLTTQLIRAETRRDLALQERQLSKYKRTLISAPNFLQKAKSIGYVGVVILSVILGVLIVIDVPTWISQLRYAFHNIRSYIRRKCGSKKYK